MRKTCPVCESTKRVENWKMDYIVPDGWENPTSNTICLCECGMIYYDNEKTQEDYDKYYKTRYDSDWALLTPESNERLEDISQLICKTELTKSIKIVDFGGGMGYIERRLKELGYPNVYTVNVGDELPYDIDLLIASHVLEHVYDLRGVMDKLVAHTKGKILIDLPDSNIMATVTSLPILDYHQKHINHFTINTLNSLLKKYSYEPTYINHYITKPHNYPALRVIYDSKLAIRRDYDVYYKSKKWVQDSIDLKVERLKEITYPVIVWGCGDICLHLLSKVPLKVIHYVDLDPAFRGQTIGGVPVLDHVDGDYPIVVIAQMQQSSVLKSIADAGLINRAIVI
jgi:hypothetical protein